MALKVRNTAEIDPMGTNPSARGGSARLAHPNITGVYELGTAETDRGDARDIAMELLHGHTLEDLLRERQLGIDECASPRRSRPPWLRCTGWTWCTGT